MMQPDRVSEVGREIRRAADAVSAALAATEAGLRRSA
jgi:hypothetical protein